MNFLRLQWCDISKNFNSKLRWKLHILIAPENYLAPLRMSEIWKYADYEVVSYITFPANFHMRFNSVAPFCPVFFLSKPNHNKIPIKLKATRGLGSSLPGSNDVKCICELINAMTAIILRHSSLVKILYHAAFATRIDKCIFTLVRM